MATQATSLIEFLRAQLSSLFYAGHKSQILISSVPGSAMSMSTDLIEYLPQIPVVRLPTM